MPPPSSADGYDSSDEEIVRAPNPYASAGDKSIAAMIERAAELRQLTKANYESSKVCVQIFAYSGASRPAPALLICITSSKLDADFACRISELELQQLSLARFVGKTASKLISRLATIGKPFFSQFQSDLKMISLMLT
jgi:hypothetical protein